MSHATARKRTCIALGIAVVAACHGGHGAVELPVETVDVATDPINEDGADSDASADSVSVVTPGSPDVVTPGPAPIPYHACAENTDCASGFCVESADGRTCTRECAEDCPDGWRCANVSVGGADVTFV